jgi:superfamily II RNA helicase
VPLQFHYCTGKRLVPLLDASQKAINPQLKKQRAPQRQPGQRGGGRVSLPFVMGPAARAGYAARHLLYF